MHVLAFAKARPYKSLIRLLIFYQAVNSSTNSFQYLSSRYSLFSSFVGHPFEANLDSKRRHQT